MSAATNHTGYFKSLMILFFALLTGQIVFFLLAIILRSMNYLSVDLHTVEMVVYIIPVIMVLTVIFSTRIFHNKLPEITAKQNLAEKLRDYRNIYIIRYAIIEGGTIFSITLYLITGISLLAVFVVIGIGIFIFLKPHKEKMIRQLQLSSQEAAALDEFMETGETE